jgi:hypothetical protein
MKTIFTFFLCSCSILSYAQKDSASGYAHLIDTADLKKHLYTLASAEMEGRETATEGQRKAATYIEQHFRKIGLLPGWTGVFQQPFPVFRDSIVQLGLELDGKPLTPGADFSVNTRTGKDSSLSANDIVFVGYGRSDSVRDDYSDVDVQGKVVLVVPGSPLIKERKKKKPGVPQDLHTIHEAASKKGAAALLVVDNSRARLHVPSTGPMYIDKMEDKTPSTFFITDSVARLIMGAELEKVKISLDSAPVPKLYLNSIRLQLKREPQQLQSTNVIGVLEGTSKKDEAIVITAHYDHMGKSDTVIHYGADDDGSGTVTILELSEAFAKAALAGNRPTRSIVFMTVSGEEKGLWGSAYYSDHPTFPMEKTSANINIDMIGRVESGRKKDSLNYVYVVGDNRLSSDLRPISETANKKSFNFSLDYKFNDPNDPQRIYYRSDHYNFARNGVPAVFYFNGLHDDYHRPSDTPDKINYPLLAKRAQLIFYTAWEMANRDAMLKRDLQ